MFDAKKLLDALTAASQAPGSQGSPTQAGASQGGAAPGGLGDILGNVLGQLQQVGQGGPGGGSAGRGQGDPTQAGAAGGGLGDILGNVLGQLQQGGQGGGAAAGGGLGGLLGSLFGQATQGLQGAARDVNAQTGLGRQIDSVLSGLTGGKGSQDILAQVKDLAANNQMATGAAMGSLASIFLGTKAGRGVTFDAAKLGGLAMIGGLAYQAWQNYQAGKPPLALGAAGPLQEAPAASPFGSTGDDTADNETSLLLLRAMIAAASADGAVDDAERAHIVGNLQAIGLDPAAAGFLDQEFANPASPEDLAGATDSPEVAAQVYTAARITIDPDSTEEQEFLASLAGALGLDAQLVANIDAAAESVKV